MKPIPVLIEDMIKKVVDPKLHPEQKQHWATTLHNIVEESQKALKVYETHRKNR